MTVPQPLTESGAEATPVVIQVAQESVAERSARFEQSVERRGGPLYKIIVVVGGVLLMISFRLLRYVDMDGNFSMRRGRSPLSAEAMQDPESWRTVTSDDRQFSVLMPGEPEWNNDRYAGSQMRTATVNGKKSRWISFSTGYLSLPEKTDAAKERFFEERLDGVRHNEIMNPNTNLRDVRRLSISDSAGHDYPGIEFTYNFAIAGNTVEITERLYLVGDKLVALQTHATKPFPTELPSHFWKFLSSLKVK